ncbi:HIRAN domain-containing protein [Aerococcaceae bacterium NML191292]|nr:HIRAN domain-containing protein [Aerococcaceae bacterium NML191292]
MNQAQFEMSRRVADFHIAGFAHWDGLEVIDELRVGTQVELKKEYSNLHDPDAIAIYYQSTKLGYVPAYKNDVLSTLFHFGHGNIFEAFIQLRDMTEHPERQFRVVVKVKDNR